MTREELIEAIEIPCIARDGSISADWLAMTLADEARIEHGRLVNPEYLAVKIAKVSDEILARVVRAEKERDEARAEVERLREALAQCAEWFQQYADGHNAKRDTDKAQRNQDRADYARAALCRAKAENAK